MKKEIIGYITGAINNHIRILESMNKYGYSKASVQSHQNYADELSDLSKFITNIPDANKEASILAFNVALENGSLKRRIVELEESCENMNEVEKNLHYKIKGIEKAMDDAWEKNKRLNLTDKERRDENYNLELSNKHVNEINLNLITELSELKQDNANWQQVCNRLRAENRDLTGPRWVED